MTRPDPLRQTDRPPQPPPAILAAAWLLVAGERLAAALWRPWCVLCLLLAVALSDLLPALPGWAHLVASAGGAAALALALRRGFAGWRPPTTAEAIRRIERDSALEHRPLSTLRDRPATAEADTAGDTATVWRAHCRSAAARATPLRLARPRVGRAAIRPLRLAGLCALVLSGAVIAVRGDLGPRLSAAFVPAPAASGAAAALDLWLAPPPYTGIAPIFLHRADAPGVQAAPAEPIAVPAGSTILARVSGGGGPPMLRVNGGDVAFTILDEGHFQARATVLIGNDVAVAQGGGVLGRWPVRVVPDAPPAIAFSAPPAPTGRGALRLEFEASDDYGVTAASAVIVPDPDAAENAGVDAAPITVPLSLPTPTGKQTRGASLHDLTAEPLAGLPVRIRLTAVDAAGQHGESGEVAIRLPERPFTDPVAREIAAQRKLLSGRAGAARAAVARSLAALSARPDSFHDDAVVFLALRAAVGRLLLDRSADGVAGVRALLWDTALRLEDGGLTLAERDLRDAERALADALDAGAPDQEVARLMEALGQALDRYLESLARQTAEEPGGGADPEALVVDREDLQAMIRSMRDMAEAGGREGARQMLSDLHRMLDGLQAGGTGAGGMSAGKGAELLRELGEITEGQRKLLERPPGTPPADRSRNPNQGKTRNPDQTPEQDADATPPALPAPAPSAAPSAADEQSALRNRLGAVAQALGDDGDIPAAFGRADQAMREAEQALRRNDAAGAASAQTRALDALRQGARTLTRSVAGRVPGGARDPLGRRPSGRTIADPGDVHVPEQRDVQRAREILDELRRRANQRERPRPELDYIDRLLRQF